jgi:hypothetical protein
MAQAMFELALKQPGCLGAASVRDTGGFGITVAYFTDESAIHAWKQNDVRWNDNFPRKRPFPSLLDAGASDVA